MQKFECELCKSPMPLVFTQNGQKFTLLDIERPQGEPYIILEHKEQNKDNNNNNNNSNSNNNEVKNENNQNTSLYVIKFNSDNNMTAKLGRGHSCEVRISDISVSRFHAKINYNADNDEFLLIDNNSKFGTLVLIQKPLTLK
jgi:pSer/pThr/pTyr-binding forkhead associated (FHA) protein